jgi:hypothetical protein
MIVLHAFCQQSFHSNFIFVCYNTSLTGLEISRKVKKTLCFLLYIVNLNFSPTNLAIASPIRSCFVTIPFDETVIIDYQQNCTARTNSECWWSAGVFKYCGSDSFNFTWFRQNRFDRGNFVVNIWRKVEENVLETFIHRAIFSSA